ncbi:MAG: proline--tRNA ligase, partial [Chloroflexota bacterium]|nr:proline--tRNA ligase [Chloroflexota bacterium]
MRALEIKGIISPAMRLSRAFGRTLREAPTDADTPGHRLLVRAGCIEQLAAGLYTMLPLGLRVQRKIEAIARRELTGAGGQEVLMPVLQPLELWQRTGRDVSYGEELFRLIDRRRRSFVLAPTHEEVVTELLASSTRSHRDLPVTLYQIQTKLRDELRPRAGLLRTREFTMLDAYSFDVDEAGMDESFATMRGTFERVFARCGVPVIPVLADSGAIGRKESVEFVLLAPTGEDTVVRCGRCGYAANGERAEFRRDAATREGQPDVVVPLDECDPMEAVDTPGVKTIEALAEALQIDSRETLKAVFYWAERGAVAVAPEAAPGRPHRAAQATPEPGELVFVGIRGDLAVNEVKLRRALGCESLRLATDGEVAAAGLVAGSASPVGVSGLHTVVDLSVPHGVNVVAGGNRPDVHLRNVNYGRDFTADVVADIGAARAGDGCVRCGGPLTLERGIELGHIFKLGLTYSPALGARYLDRDGQQQPMWMGCYGIGIGRTLAAAVEASHDAQGIIWPPPLAPYDVHLVALNPDNADVARAAGDLYSALQGAGVDVLFDDRLESAGVKFNDADLLGSPQRVTVGPRGVRQGEIEIRRRASAPAPGLQSAG